MQCIDPTTQINYVGLTRDLTPARTIKEVLISRQALEAMVYSGKRRSDVETLVETPMSGERTETAGGTDDEPITRPLERHIQTSDRVHVMPAHGHGAVLSTGASGSKQFPAAWHHGSMYGTGSDEPGTIREQQARNPGIDRGSAILAELQSRLLQDQLQDKMYLQTDIEKEHEHANVIVEKRFRPSRLSGPNDVLEMQRNVLLQPGCVVSTRVILRKCPKFRINGLLEAMQAMRQAEYYVGELCQIQSHVRVFYKCPPQLIQPEALEKYSVSLEEYTFQFEQNPQPARSGPSDWESYVTKLIEHAPYNAQLLPLEKMSLDGGALKRLRKFREQLPVRR